MEKQALKMDFSTQRSIMKAQTYFHTRYEYEANRRNDSVPLEVNCVGAVSGKEFFTNKSVRQDYYYLYVLKGKLILPDGTLEAGDVMIWEPGYEYQYQGDAETVYLWVHYTGFEAQALTQSALPKRNVKQHIGIHREIIDCFRKLFHEFMVHDVSSGQLSVCLLKEILFYTGRYTGTGKPEALPLKAIEYIHSHFQAEVDIDALAQMEHMSCTAFRIAFKKHTGVSPNEYLISHRISTACQRLLQTDMSIRAVAAEVGYRDQYYFSRIFKQKVGVSPLKYRNSRVL